jgi:hypothetical protein
MDVEGESIMKQLFFGIAALAMLSACAGGASNPPLASDSRTMSLAQDATARAATAHIVYPVRSLYEVVYPRGYKGVAYTLNGKCSLTRGPNDIVTGCVITGGSASPYYKKSSFYLHNKPNGDGCTIAVGHFQGQTYSGQVIPITFYWVKNSCYP